jgi:hypothetical protein
LREQTSRAEKPAQVAGFISEWWPASNRYGGRDQVGIGGRIESEIAASSLVCPIIENDHCAAYTVRPLACRGHASYDEEACRDTLLGGTAEVPVSALHLTVRSLVQNAMQSALRDAGLAWGSYELNQALHIALCDETSEQAWMAGDDVFVPALITDISLREMAETFDAIKAMAA